MSILSPQPLIVGGAVADIAPGTLPGSALATDADVDKVPLAALKDEVINSMASGLDPANFLGPITSLSQSIPAAAANSGKWYSSEVAGTLTDADVSSITVAIGDRLLSNGTAWQKYAAPPTVRAIFQYELFSLWAAGRTSLTVAPTTFLS